MTSIATMVHFRNEIDIHASPEAVFDELSDLRNEMRWSPKMSSVELLSGEPITVGSRLRARWAGTPDNAVVYTEYARPKRWVTASTSWPLVVKTALEVAPTDASSRLISTWNLRPRGPMRLLGRVLGRALSKDVAESMRRANTHVEQRAVRN